jgi:valyl-tRNA synthetase
VRALRAELGLAALRAVPQAFYEGDLDGGESVVASQAWVEKLEKGSGGGVKCVSATVEGVDVHLPIGDLVDEAKELARLEREETKLRDQLDKLEQRLGNPNFVERAKPEVVERERASAQELRDALVKIGERRKLFGG